MSWQYSDPLNGALLAAQKPNSQSDLGLGISPFYSSYDPLYSRYQPRNNFYDRTPASINLFDDLDDFDLEVETDDILNSARYRVSNSFQKQPAYIPSYYNSIASDINLIDSTSDLKNQLSNRSLNFENTYKIKNKPENLSPNPYQNAFKPMPFDLRSTPPSSFKSDNSYPHSINSSEPNNHNSHHQRFVQYQHRLMQDRGDNKSELENLKLKQKQDRTQLLDTIQKKNNLYQPLYQEHHIIKKQYSETSIPSTNADPLNSNSPTPPMMHHKQFSKNNKKDKNNLQKNNSDFYYKLKDNKEKQKYHTIKDKYTSNDYKQYQKNFGFGQQFLPFETETKQEKIERTKKREEYSKKIKEQNLKINNNNHNNNNAQHKFIGVKESNIYEPIANRRINEYDFPKRNANFKGKEATRAK